MKPGRTEPERCLRGSTSAAPQRAPPARWAAARVNSVAGRRPRCCPSRCCTLAHFCPGALPRESPFRSWCPSCAAGLARRRSWRRCPRDCGRQTQAPSSLGPSSTPCRQTPAGSTTPLGPCHHGLHPGRWHCGPASPDGRRPRCVPAAAPRADPSAALWAPPRWRRRCCRRCCPPAADAPAALRGPQQRPNSAHQHLNCKPTTSPLARPRRCEPSSSRAAAANRGRCWCQTHAGRAGGAAPWESTPVPARTVGTWGSS
mmetsp:Transcript_20004/g.47308  ORF Transcript_20004/g.47308 Transcript_20004/m.47308 type:complete len:258 (-) Transcript_20004:1356-2129(-)